MEVDKKNQGLSLKTTSFVTMILSLFITLILLFTGIRTFRSFRRMEESTDDFIMLENAASNLMNASDYLTDEVQSFTVIGDVKHMENYFTEAEITRRREHALASMEEAVPDSPALKELKEGMKKSLALMEREYYAMRLIVETLDVTEMPEALKNVSLTEEDRALDPGQKILLAQRMVHDSAYNEQKDKIRISMAACIDALKSDTRSKQQETEEQANRELIWMSVFIVLQTAAMFIMIRLTTHLGVNPVLRAVDHIKKGQKLPIVGASEFRYLASAYNTMYSAYRKSIDQLSFKASHDELTGVYNRAGYDLLLSSLDMRSTALLLIDADQFKEINDRHGHEVGDRILKKIARTLKENFRSDDYVCRIGGDEYVVFMVHPSDQFQQMVTRKVLQINQALSAQEDGLPLVTLSVGVAYDPKVADPGELFRRADLALYYVKEHGRDGCCFYTDSLKDLGKPETRA